MTTKTLIATAALLTASSGAFAFDNTSTIADIVQEADAARTVIQVLGTPQEASFREAFNRHFYGIPGTSLTPHGTLEQTLAAGVARVYEIESQPEVTFLSTQVPTMPTIELGRGDRYYDRLLDQVQSEVNGLVNSVSSVDTSFHVGIGDNPNIITARDARLSAIPVEHQVIIDAINATRTAASDARSGLSPASYNAFLRASVWVAPDLPSPGNTVGFYDALLQDAQTSIGYTRTMLENQRSPHLSATTDALITSVIDRSNVVHATYVSAVLELRNRAQAAAEQAAVMEAARLAAEEAARIAAEQAAAAEAARVAAEQAAERQAYLTDLFTRYEVAYNADQALYIRQQQLTTAIRYASGAYRVALQAERREVNEARVATTAAFQSVRSELYGTGYSHDHAIRHGNG